MTEQRDMWKWVERIVVAIGAILGVIAFFWQLEDRRDSRREQLLASYSGLRIVEDTFVVVEIDLQNIGRKTVQLRSVLAAAEYPDSLHRKNMMRRDTG